MWDWLAAAVGIQHRAQRGDGGHLAPARQRTTALLHYCTTGGAYFRLFAAERARTRGVHRIPKQLLSMEE
jgi:hypothetical protein